MVNLSSLAGNILAGCGVHVFDPVWWYRCTGQVNVAGKVTPAYADPVLLSVQARTASDAALYHADKVGQNNTTREFYINSTPQGDVSGLVRQEETGGDLLFYKGGWWLVTAVPEDFSAMGWIKVRATWQTVAPEGVVEPVV